jgi:hypothetical protein
MASIEDLARNYASLLKNAKQENKEKVAEEIFERINNLTYANTNQPISNQDKEKILDEMKYDITGWRPGQTVGILQDTDNSKHLALVASMLASIKGTKK